ncbi:MAG: hypothetical protein GEU95_01055 [Rhizobiales bacterium]|nr:hypothetical protein [Hyphomicrobiales bacterium]
MSEIAQVKQKLTATRWGLYLVTVTFVALTFAQCERHRTATESNDPCWNLRAGEHYLRQANHEAGVSEILRTLQPLIARCPLAEDVRD